MRLHSSLLRRWSLTLIAITGVTCALSAQTDDDRMQVDRPDQSQGTSVLAPRRLQLEWGVGGDSGAQLRLGGQLERPHHGAVQFSTLTFSSKLSLFSGEGWIPAMALVGDLNYTPQEERRRLTGDLTLAFEQELTSGFYLTYNIGSAEGMRRLAVTAELGYDFSDRLSSFVEYYGVFGPAVHGCDLGLSYAHPHLSPLLSKRRDEDRAWSPSIEDDGTDSINQSPHTSPKIREVWGDYL